MEMMKAVRAHRRGGPEELVFEVAPRPEPARGDALVAVYAASVTPGELSWSATWTDRSGPDGRDRTPIVPAHEMSGVVVKVGPEVTDVDVGDEVYGLIPFVRDGAAAEFVTVPADLLAGKPVSIDHDAAACIPLSALTAWQALVVHAGLQADHHVLIHGAAGGVGSFAVQIAAGLGAHVTATARGRDRAFVRGLGATEVVDYAHGDFENCVDRVDVVLDLVGGRTQARSWDVLRPGGVLVSIVAPPDAEAATHHRARGTFFVVEPDRSQLRALAHLVDDGRLTPVVDRVLPLADTRAAYEALDAGHRRGKIVLHVAG